ncbi:MAG TPA: outer membrane protein transport protein [Kofleriaceae bacterium]|nr:outer membrane protein transport protein [Kofleriaceae bacterium]
MFVAPAPAARAGGLFLPARGARGLGVAGSLTASADDGSALYYNPAGLADSAGTGVLVDAGLVLQRVGYDRIDSGGNPQPHVKGDTNLLPIPTVAVSWKLDSEPRLTLAAGVWTPYLGVNTWPDNGPQRYSDVTLNGSILAVPELAAAYRVNDRLSVGVGLQDMVINFRSKVVLSACSQLNCAPEDPGFDALSEVRTKSVLTPSGILGADYKLDNLKLGLAVQLPFFVRSSGTARSRLPTDPQFVNAKQVGDQTDLDFDLPLEVRLGAAARLTPHLTVEVGFDFEAWSMQKDISIRAHDIQIQGIPGVGSYTFNKIAINRDLDNTYAVHGGAEWEAVPHTVIVRAGYLLETSATPDRTASVLAPDGLHNLISAGVGLPVGRVRVDLGYGHLFTSDRTVRDSQALQLNPIQPSLAVAVGNGKYTVSTDIVSAGVAGQF